MILKLNLDSNAGYIVATKACSCAGVFHYIGSKDGQLFNGPVHYM